MLEQKVAEVVEAVDMVADMVADNLAGTLAILEVVGMGIVVMVEVDIAVADLDCCKYSKVAGVES